jgi:hypothetical protein
MLDPSFTLQIPLLGVAAEVELYLCKWGDAAAGAQDPGRVSGAMFADRLLSTLFNTVAKVDGKRVFGARRDALAGDPAAVAAILHRRHEIYERVRGSGRLFAQCPHCHDGEVELALLGLFDTLGTLPPPMFTDDFAYFLPPILGYPIPIPERPAGVAYASRLRFVLPTKVLDLPRQGFESGLLQDASFDREHAGWQRWETDGVNVPVGRAWWSRHSHSFRATIRLIAALRWVSPRIEVTPEALEELPAVDLYFLDALYWYTHCVDVPAHAPPRTCPKCGRAFLPVSPPEPCDGG